MKKLLGVMFLLSTALVAPAIVTPAASAQTGSIEFVARVTPTDGLEEPVRGFPIFLLSRSYEVICKDASTSVPAPDMDAFIDKLDVSPDLKAWMKKNHWVTLSGEDFIHKLKVPDVMNVPEFFNAYKARNAGDEASNFPDPKFKASDEKKHPEKYKLQVDEYTEAIRAFMTQHPDSIDGIDGNLTEVDPSPKWTEIEGKYKSAVRQRGLNLARSTYLVAKVQTDLQGQGSLRGVPPGTYWLSSLDMTAEVGDARPRWDVPVTVQAGKTQFISLSNANALPPAFLSP
ncbi:MAG TPA: hypothetical protein VMB02_17270 [Candidatus Aquilonibacter sp.]|nr:hypothetical protein [Candidatus Aquilonibacter sp.]